MGAEADASGKKGRPRPGLSRKGLTALEIVVAMAIIAILTAVLVPGFRVRQQAADAAALVSQLRSLRQAIGNYRNHVGWYPSSLVQLQALPGGGGLARTNSCGAAVAQATFNARWRGSYFGGLAGVGGMQVGAMTISPALTRTEFTGGRAFLRISTSEVNVRAAEHVDAALDGGAFSPTSGAVTWVETGSSGHGTLQYNFPVEGC